MSSKKEFIGVFDTKVEKNGKEEERRIYIHGKGSSIFLDDGLGEILVHPSNQYSQEGWIKEYALCRNVKVLNYEFKPPFLLREDNSS